MSDNKNEWTLEYPIKVGRNLISYYWLRDEPGAINSYKERLNWLQGVLGKSKQEVMAMIFFAGLAALEAEEENKDQVPERGTEEYKIWSTVRELKISASKRTQNAALAQIYAEKTPQEFTTWALDAGYGQNEIDQFLDRHSWRAPDLKQSDRDRDWLREVLSDVPKPVAEIKEQARQAGIVTCDDDYLRLAKTAQREGYTGGKHGFWSRP